jgi:hypothetical protein
MFGNPPMLTLVSGGLLHPICMRDNGTTFTNPRPSSPSTANPAPPNPANPWSTNPAANTRVARSELLRVPAVRLARRPRTPPRAGPDRPPRLLRRTVADPLVWQAAERLRCAAHSERTIRTARAGLRICRSCGETRPESGFLPLKGTHWTYGRCRECRNARARARYPLQPGDPRGRDRAGDA